MYELWYFYIITAVKKVIDEKTLDMEIIVNPKHLDNGQNVIQLETAVGAAMKCFDGCLGRQMTKYMHIKFDFCNAFLLISTYIIRNEKINLMRFFHL